MQSVVVTHDPQNQKTSSSSSENRVILVELLRIYTVMNCGGFGTEAFFLLVLSYTKTRIENIGALIIAVGSSGLAISGELNLLFKAQIV